MIAQHVFRVSRLPAVAAVLVLLAGGGAGAYSYLVPGSLVSRPLSVAAVAIGFGGALLMLPAVLLTNRLEVGAAGVTVVRGGRRARFWWPEIVAMGEQRRRRRSALVVVPRESTPPVKRGPVAFDPEFGGWILARPARLRVDLSTVATVVNEYAPGVWRDRPISR